MKKNIIIGAGGFGREIAWSCSRAGLEVAGFCDDAPEKQSGTLDELPLLGTIEQVRDRIGPEFGFQVAVGDNRIRQKLAQRALAAGWQPLSVVDPTALVAPDVPVGAGSYVAAGVVISRGSRLGEFVIVNFQATVGHDCRLDDYAQLCPGARLSGGCVMEEGAFMGSNAVAIPLRRLGAWSTAGAGTLVLRDLPAGESIVRLR